MRDFFSKKFFFSTLFVLLEFLTKKSWRFLVFCGTYLFFVFFGGGGGGGLLKTQIFFRKPRGDFGVSFTVTVEFGKHSTSNQAKT